MKIRPLTDKQRVACLKVLNATSEHTTADLAVFLGCSKKDANFCKGSVQMALLKFDQPGAMLEVVRPELPRREEPRFL